MANFLFDRVNRLIIVEAPTTSITIQEVSDAIKDYEDSPLGMSVNRICQTTGKDDLGGGIYSGITLRLYNWKIKFEDRAGPTWVECYVEKGNLLSEDGGGSPQFPLEPASYVMASYEKAVSAALLNAETGVADAVWDELMNEHNGAGSFGKRINELDNNFSEVLAKINNNLNNINQLLEPMRVQIKKITPSRMKTMHGKDIYWVQLEII